MKRGTRQLLMYGAIGYAAFWLWKRKQAGAVAIANPSAPSTAVSPTAAPTTANMQALTGLGGGYNLPLAVPVRRAVRYPAPSVFQRFN